MKLTLDPGYPIAELPLERRRLNKFLPKHPKHQAAVLTASPTIQAMVICAFFDDVLEHGMVPEAVGIRGLENISGILAFNTNTYGEDYDLIVKMALATSASIHGAMLGVIGPYTLYIKAALDDDLVHYLKEVVKDVDISEILTLVNAASPANDSGVLSRIIADKILEMGSLSPLDKSALPQPRRHSSNLARFSASLWNIIFNRKRGNK